MNANQARAESQKNSETIISAELKNARRAIEEACKGGKFAARTNWLSFEAKAALEKEGFTVKNESDMRENTNWSLISW